MTQESYFGQNGVIKMYDTSTTTPTEISIGIVQNWKVDVSFDMNELYGMGSIVYQGVARSKFAAAVSCEFCAFDIMQLAKIIDPESTGTGTSVEIKQRTDNATNGDTTKVFNQFKFEGTFEGQGGVTQTITVGGVYFENFPWEATNDDWIKLNLSGKGNSYKVEQTTQTPSGP